jgi:hypothetical protein
MRYMLLTYIRKPNGQIDEQIQVTTKLRERDLTTCNVILDFKDKKVEKASIDGTSIPRNWETIVEYYREHYADLIEDLEKSNKPILQ